MVDSQKQLITLHLKVCAITDIIHPNINFFVSFSKTFCQSPFCAWPIQECDSILEIGVIFLVCILHLIILFYEPHTFLNILHSQVIKWALQCGINVFKFMQQVVLHPQQGKSSLLQRVIITENYNQSKCKIMKPNHSGYICKTVLYLRFRQHCRRR